MGAPLETGSKTKGAKPIINVTPLVDVVLVLLIIFMVVLPNVQDGKPIEMVKVDRAEKSKSGGEPISVTIDAREVYTLGEEDTSRAEVLRKLAAEFERDPGRRVLLRADAGLPYKTVRSLFADIQNVGFKVVGLAVGVSAEWKEEHGAG